MFAKDEWGFQVQLCFAKKKKKIPCHQKEKKKIPKKHNKLNRPVWHPPKIERRGNKTVTKWNKRCKTVEEMKDSAFNPTWWKTLEAIVATYDSPANPRFSFHFPATITRIESRAAKGITSKTVCLARITTEWLIARKWQGLLSSGPASWRQSFQSFYFILFFCS